MPPTPTLERYLSDPAPYAPPEIDDLIAEMGSHHPLMALAPAAGQEDDRQEALDGEIFAGLVGP